MTCILTLICVILINIDGYKTCYIMKKADKYDMYFNTNICHFGQLYWLQNVLYHKEKNIF